MSEFEVEKGIPLPQPRRKTGFVEALRQLQIGESILATRKSITAVSSAVRYATIGTTRKYTSRTVDGGVRVWRIE